MKEVNLMHDRSTSIWSRGLAILLAITLAASPMVITGCSSAQVQDTLLAAEQVLEVAIPAVKVIDPEVAGYMTEADAGVKTIAGLYQSYLTAAASAKPGVAGEIQSAITALTSNLQNALNVAQVKNSSTLLDVTAAVEVVATAINIVISHITGSTPAAAPIVAHAQSAVAKLPIIAGAKNGDDLRVAWNKDHPRAHIKTGMRHLLGVPIPLTHR